MTWPVNPLPSTGPFPRDNDTPASFYHAQDHNDLLNAVNDIVHRIGESVPKTATYGTTESRLLTRTREAAFVIAPYDAPDYMKEAADIVLSGPSGAQNDGDVISSALTAAGAAGGGRVFLGPGSIHLYQSIVFTPGSTDRVELVGSGLSTQVKRRANIPSVSVRGTGTGAGGFCAYNLISDIYFRHDPSDAVSSWKTFGIDISYAISFHIRDCRFYNFTTAAISAKCWRDSYLTNILMDSCGSLPTDSAPSQFNALEFLCATAGAGTDTNNIYCDNITIANFNIGAITIMGNSSQKITNINFNRLRLDNPSNVCGKFLGIGYADAIDFKNLYCLVGDFRAGYSTRVNVIGLSNCRGVLFDKAYFTITSTAVATVDSFLLFFGPNVRCGYNNIMASVAKDPHVAMVAWSASNTESIIGELGFTYTTGTAVLVSGAPTTTSMPLFGKPYVQTYVASTTLGSGGAWGNVPFSAADTYDSHGFHDPVTNNTRFTIPANMSGFYRINTVVGFEADSTGDRAVGIRVNGATDPNLVVLIEQPAATINTHLTYISGSVTLKLNAGDYIQLAPYQNSGGTINISARLEMELFIFQG